MTARYLVNVLIWFILYRLFLPRPRPRPRLCTWPRPRPAPERVTTPDPPEPDASAVVEPEAAVSPAVISLESELAISLEKLSSISKVYR